MTSSIPWGPIRSMLQTNFSFVTIKEIIGYTGIDMTRIAHLEQRSHNSASKSQLLSAIDQQIEEADDTEVTRIAVICCEEMLRQKPDFSDELDRVLSRVGWRFVQRNLVPIELFDGSELPQFPSEAHEDLIKAAIRLRDGDLSGALSSACSAVDSVTSSVYQKYNLVPDSHSSMDSFQKKVKKSLDALEVKADLKEELNALGWNGKRTDQLTNNLFKSLNQAANVMQTLRSDMGDVHGTRPVLAALVYDSLKWSALLLRFLSKQ